MYTAFRTPSLPHPPRDIIYSYQVFQGHVVCWQNSAEDDGNGNAEAYEVFETIKNFADNGYTMIVVTHQISAVHHFANKIVFMEHGNICVEGSTEGVLNNTNNQGLKKFLERVEFSDL